ncbi:MAG: VWA domain-containing protein [Synergistaceae bacterium]|nr:VWA domain-containing protein [Synergistaceae bacterium]
METTKNNITELIFILDRSGSMSGKESDVVGGYNSFIDKQIEEHGETVVTTVLFNEHCKTLFNGVPAGKAKLVSEQYVANGTTALLDAIGNTIFDVSSRIARTAEYLRPRNVIVIITTDGLENASREFTNNKVKEMIEQQKNLLGWSFIFLGADIDAYAEAQKLSIAACDTIKYDSSKEIFSRAFSGKVYARCSAKIDELL